MNSLDTKTLVHVGVEVVVIGGVAFWLNGKISTVQKELAEALGRIQRMEEIINQQNQVITRHEMILRQIMGGRPPPTPPEQPRSVPPPQNIHVEEKGPEEVPPEELDELLGEDLLEILEERRECQEDTCTLKPKKHRKKEVRRKNG